MADERGSATVENMFWLPVLFLVLAGIVQFGLIFNARSALQTASFEAARVATVAADPAAASREAVFNFAQGVLPGWRQGQSVRTEVSMPAGPSPGSPVVVKVEYDVPVFFAGFLPGLETSRGIKTVKGSSRMTIEEKP